MVIPRAIVRDLADGHDAARLMSRLILVMGAAPILAPTLGGLVLGFGSWRTIFWIATAYGAICTTLVIFLLPDTMAVQHRMKLSLGGLLERYLSVLRDRVFLCYVLLGGFGMFGMFAYIGGSPPVLIQHFGFAPAQYGAVFGASAIFFIGASQISPLLLRRVGAARILRTATTTYLVAAIIMVLCAMFHVGGVFGIVLPVVVLMGCMGMALPNAAVGALSRHAAQAGTASAIMGTLQFTLAAISGALVGLLADGTARPMAGLILFAAIAAVTADRLRARLQPVGEAKARALS